MAIQFFSEGIDFKLPQPRRISNWIKTAIIREGDTLGNVSYIFCNDAFLLDINQRHLNHDTYTDIITFDLSDQDSAGINGEIYISIERIKENAKKYKIHFTDELLRVMIHGILHLIGYRDKSATEKALMRKKEEAYLSLYK